MSFGFHATGNNLFTTTAASVSSGDSTIDAVASGLDALSVPFYADLGHEIVEVTHVSANTPASGKSRWTVRRGVYGSAANYAAGVPVAQRNYAEQYTELQRAADASWAATRATLAAGNGVISSLAETECKVTPTNGVVGVTVAAGVVVLDDLPVNVALTQLILAVPPTSFVNYQIRASNAGVVSALEVAAGTGAASGYYALADVRVNYNDTYLLTAAITDRRAFV